MSIVKNVTEWVFQAKPPFFDVHGAVEKSPYDWWNTPHHRAQIAVGDRVWIQVAGQRNPGIHYVAFVERPVYEAEPEDPERPNFGRWRTDVRFDSRLSPYLSRHELLANPQLASGQRIFRGFQGSNAILPPEIAASLDVLAASTLVPIESR